MKLLKKLYDTRENLFAILWIVVYCLITIPIRGELGDESVWMLAVLAVIALAAALFIRKYHLEEKYGLDRYPAGVRRYWYFIPMLILMTGNLWGGFRVAYSGISQLYAVLSMLLIGFIEEVIFRGFLFKMMLKANGVRPAIIVSSVTFGIGHLVNLLAGQTSLESVLQVFFAIAWGFIFTMVFYKCGSLWPNIIVHGLVDAFSKFAADNPTMEWVYVISTIIIAIVYCIPLSKLDPAPNHRIQC